MDSAASDDDPPDAMSFRPIMNRISRRPFASFRALSVASFELAALLAAALTLRFTDLGYSNLQGDEIKALCSPHSFNSIIEFLAFLLAQRKGPVEFSVTCAVGLIDPAFSSELLLRLPFAVANLLSLACLFVVAWRLFSRDAALYSTFLIATSGVFVAFGRFAQYQSFVMLGVSAALMGMVLAVERDRWRIPGVYLGFAAAACGLLAHFDAAFVLPPMAVLTAHWWLRARRRPDARRLTWHLVGAGTLFSILVLGFYVEFARHLNPSQVSYWTTRLAGPTTNTLATAMFYTPAPFVWIELAAAGLGLLRLRNQLGWQVLMTWLVPPLVFMELIFRNSRTHAYTYFLPLMLIAGLGLSGLTSWTRRRWGPRIGSAVRGAVLVVLVLNAYASYALLVNHTPEYPWQPKTVLGTNMPGGYLTGTFGFPYNRDWRAVGAWFAALPRQDKVVVTNESPEIAGFYLPAKIHLVDIHLEPPERTDPEMGVYVIIVPDPQSWEYRVWGWSLDEWHQRLHPTATFVNAQGEPSVWLFFLTYDQIRALFH